MTHINRRSLLSWLGASAATTLIPLSGVAEAMPKRRTRILSIESFRVRQMGEISHLHAYLQSTLLPLLGQIHEGPKMVLDAIVAPHLPQALLLTVFSSFDQMLGVRSRIAAEPGIRRARASLESADPRVLNQVQSQVMIATDESLRVPTGSEGLESGVFELRSYHTPAWNDMPLDRIGAVFARSGIRPIVDAATAAGEHLPQFTYLIPFESLAVRQASWARLDADPEWLEIQRMLLDRYGLTLKVTEKSIYKLAPYSRLA
jgi:hypothetical protein